MGLADMLGRAALGPFARALPPMDETERAALEAGTVGFEGELFAGQSDFDSLRKRGPNRLTAEEQAFLDDDVRALCAMLDDHAIAKHAHRQGLGLREAALALGEVSGEDFDRWVDPQQMLGPRPD